MNSKKLSAESVHNSLMTFGENERNDINISEQISLFKLIKFDKHPDESIPSGISLVKKQLWCPYCSNIVTFKKDKKSGVKKCPICNISEKDFWVKKVNKL